MCSVSACRMRSASFGKFHCLNEAFFRLKDNEKKSKMQRTMLQLKEITLRSVAEIKVYADVRKTDLIFIAAPLLRLPKFLF